ncbi:putative bifunctional diguanylate cyclase/phosphodiesterase [Actinoplanes sp. URMC 104]|uniref:putative bifunctional diguanylate cyclase/phosphodiesterase n=1 Tax=Actinoplanes sp. URMC 104 TaxID=3423409 RepID=UPI003F194EE4
MDAGAPARPRKGVLGLGLYLALAVPLLAVQTLAPPAVQGVAFILIMALGLAALHVGPRRHLPPAERGPWRYLRTAAYLFVAATVVRVAVPSTDTSPPTKMMLIPDALVLPAYVCIGTSFALMLRRRRAADDDPAQVDALLVGLAGAFLTWTFVMAPAVAGSGMDLLRIVDACFPVIDVVLLVLIAQLMLAGGVRQPSLWLLVVSATAMFVGDLLYTLHNAQLIDVAEQTFDSMFALMLVTVPAAALHPSMRTLTEPQQIVVRDLSRRRLIVIGLVVAVPTAVTSMMPRSGFASDLVRATLSVLLILAVLARVVRSNNSRARAEQASRRRATHDALTDLPNRELLSETVSRWAEQADGLDISLLFIDLDRFKMVNDHWGHKVGDELLCAVADRLSAQVRAGDLVSRIGGDEFVIALASPSHSRLAESLADRLIEDFARPFPLSVGDVVISASIGVARSHGGAHALELIRDADTAMYKAKGSGRNAVALFDSSLRERVRERVHLEQALRGAAERGELAVHFQPIVDVATEELDGFEALMRWQSPQLGFVSPAEFIPVAEETGMIVEMGEWLLRESARQLVEWSAVRGPTARPLHMSVNVAVRQLRDGSLVRIVDEVLRDTGLPPSSLWLEITESGVMEDIEATLLTLNALHALGVTLCIDDFGTGYSSLSYLQRLPIGIVKIDRSFVSRIADGADEPIVRAVLAMTHAMGHRVVAEGVETPEQRDWLRNQACDLIQGWFYGKADRPENLTHWLTPKVSA